MKYISTRGNDGPLGFEQVLLSGLARDGGLFLPVSWPHFSFDEICDMRTLNYAELAGRVMAPFCDGEISELELTRMAADAYADFDDPAVAPLVSLDGKIHILELFHGPTIAFKDYAMQFLARTFDRALSHRKEHAVILGATSGDTGSAALEAFKGRDSIDVFILFPDGRVSPFQQRQMTSVKAKGAHAVAVKGDFDDCQALVKNLFNDLDFRDAVNLSAVNSINWARLMPQVVYYFSSALKLGAPDRKIAFSVPTGNFGNVFAGYVALQMGLPIERLIIASNKNDILPRFFSAGAMERETVIPSLSPSMDIQVSSNFERLLFEVLDRDSRRTANLMDVFSSSGKFQIDQKTMSRFKKTFAAFRVDDEDTQIEIAKTLSNDGVLIDPHTAIGLCAARRACDENLVASDVPIISLACAHPAKFEETVNAVTGIRPSLPSHLADLMSRQETKLYANSNEQSVKQLILSKRRN